MINISHQYIMHLSNIMMEKKTSEKHAAEDKDHALLYMHLNDLEINML